jgi:putative Holliday junction resolvase
MTLLCIDFGLKRVGTAIGSTDSGIAFTRNTLQRDEHLFVRLGDMIKLENVDSVLVGDPLKHDRSAGDIESELQKFLDQLKHSFALPVTLVNERYTSKIASRKLHQININAMKQKATLDSLAAQIMLQEWLDSQKS